MKNKMDSKLLISLIMATLAALLVVHVMKCGQIVGYCLIAILCYMTVLYPEVGILSILPLLYILPPTPKSIGIKEILFATILSLTFLRAVFDHRVYVVRLLKTKTALVPVVFGVLIIINLGVAISNNISASDWLRGLIPFLFLLHFVPVYLTLKENNDLLEWILASVFIAGFLFSGHVLQVYLAEQLWVNHPWLWQDGQWIKIPLTSLQNNNQNDVFFFKQRVTALLQQATDSFIPLSAVWGITGYTFFKIQWVRWCSLFLAVVGVVAAVLTYTRSMILSAVLVTIVLGGWAILRGWNTVKSYFLVSILLVLTSLAVIKSSELQAIYSNRVLELATAKGENITSRLEEIYSAWDLFVQSPFVGQGLGVKHVMRFHAGHGNLLEQNVGYIHNWFFYMLMVGGVLFLLVYSGILFGPAYLALRSRSLCFEYRLLIISGVLLLSVYAMFFAVFRLMGFNLLLAVFWGIVANERHLQEQV